MKREVYIHRSKFFQNNFDTTDLPNECPLCGVPIEPHEMTSAENLQDEFDPRIYTISACPHCKKVFYSAYNPVDETISICPKTSPQHSETIKTAFPIYVNLYQESHCAEEHGLINIAGPSYRKALEFLVKEFCILRNPNKIDEIEKSFLGNCIKNYVSDSRIKALAERATWLGNDETHYKKLFADKDIQDLKNLIHLTETFISYDIEAEKAINEIQPK